MTAAAGMVAAKVSLRVMAMALWSVMATKAAYTLLGKWHLLLEIVACVYGHSY